MKILVAGGTGFVGTAIVHALRARGLDVRVLVRHPERVTALESLGVELVRGDLTDADSLAPAVEGCTHVVHLVAIIKGAPDEFERVMTRGTAASDRRRARRRRRAVRADERARHERADEHPGSVLRSQVGDRARGRGLRARARDRPPELRLRAGRRAADVRQAGELFAGRHRDRRRNAALQPIWLEDVAQYFATIVDDARAPGRTWELGGPDIVTWNELYQAIARSARQEAAAPPRPVRRRPHRRAS